MNALDTSMIAYRAQNSTFLVKTENETVNGFFVREGLVATSSRILEDGADRIYLQSSMDNPVLFHVDGAAFQDSESGIAVLRVSSLWSRERVLPLSGASVQAGDRVYVVENIEKGFAHRLEGRRCERRQDGIEHAAHSDRRERPRRRCRLGCPERSKRGGRRHCGCADRGRNLLCDAVRPTERGGCADQA